jgi:hypothetical protein
MRSARAQIKTGRPASLQNCARVARVRTPARGAKCRLNEESILSGWRKSSFSGAIDCLEACRDRDQILVRDSKDPAGPHLALPPAAWLAFLTEVRTGLFDR